MTRRRQRNLFLCLRITVILALFLSTTAAAQAVARDEIAGPVEAKILRVIDGDTLLVEARPWPQQKVEVYVRIRGIDTPEIRSSCASERQAEAAEAARQALELLAASSSTVELSRISGDKYFDRVVADVTLAGGKQPAEHLLLAGLAVSYDGGRKAKQDCK
ncbi:endonuclease YncB(thermonuclease family) [Pseudorhizobium tarimense]|uniref:Endonuclease YncB(Thermonuclease family) n=1 Tax=Pseudorhizobium tarimense TaxID=1079109 RepID=A0ABV2H873_9HYPH|nr:thermonuclease family protein [Pseudorhizobium tarimense]MCJ8519840.1 thermonuclease family protein [Pseudorhizobium tarimense]